uniref:Myb-like domain-containing protein n=1 Tax=Trichobilharzia regenti TaxID=157069 RepID=A0AA85J6P0_TRIRE|nr:unnamed protein product [Trichobilharzia regenti]
MIRTLHPKSLKRTMPCLLKVKSLVGKSLTRRVEESLPDHLSHPLPTNKFVANVCSEETGNCDPTASFQLEKTIEQSPPSHSLSFLDKDEDEEREADTVEEGNTNNNTRNKSVDAKNPDNDVYSQFLRSLFASPCNSSNCTPNKSNSQITTPIKSTAICANRLRDDSDGVEPPSSDKCHSDFQNSKTKLSSSQSLMGWNINVDEDEDPDDPEFDVMAELDEVDREDFFYELRDDRAVRVSKVETKKLHSDLRALFNCGDEQENCTYKSRRPSVLAMKAYRQRLLQMNRTTPNQTEKFDMTRFFQSALPSSKNVNTSVVSIPIRKRIALTSTELVRLERQLGMHIQLLTTSFLLTYDFPDMHESTTRPCASLLKTLVAKRQAFDLVALQKKVSGAIHSVTSFYWRCPTLDMAVDLISDYSGLSMLPRLPWNPYKQGVGHMLTKSQSFAFPIPYCLLDIMINSPIWSYAYLMPTVLGPHPKSHVRLVFHPSEDALMIMGLADFSGALTRCRRALESKMSSQRCFSRSLKSQNKQPGRYIAYRLIGRYILPHRTFLQLRSRRWNLLANRDSIDNAGDSKPVSVATRYLLQLYKELSQPGEVDLKRMQQYANEMSSLAIPYGIPLITSCLTDRNPQELFTFEGLPTEVGYEDVLSYNNFCESVKRKLDVLTEFTQNANCFWKSQMEKASRTETNYLSVLDDESMIKSEQPTQCDVLGPNYLPAIPVDLNPDGTVVLSRTREPSLVEVTRVTDEAGSISNEHPRNLPSSEVQHGPVCQRVTSHHIEFILARINKRKSGSYTNNSEARSVADCDISNCVVTHGVRDFIQGEEQFNEISNVFESHYNNTGNVALDACQKSFEEIDVLARNPIGIPNASDESNQSASVCNVDEYIHQLEADTNDPVNNLSSHIQSLFSDGWEICTDLSSAAYNRNNPPGTAWARRQCPCLCHVNVSPIKAASIMNQCGKPAKVDSLGLRHCISCSLRVHRGTLYIDECNLHLRHVQITWPPGFKPKTRLPTSIPSSDALSTQNHRLTTMQHASSISTRVAVNELAKVHSKSYSSNKLSNHCTRLPDMAGRRVSVEYVHTRKPTTPINHEIIPSNNHGYSDTLGAVEIQSPCSLTDLNPRSFLEHNESDSIPQDLRSKSGYLENPISWTLDDEAACFNTEAFASVSDENHECEFGVFSKSDMDGWTPEEDRQLLEFCKSRGRYSSKMFSILAEIWEPKPYDFSPQRNANELEARFKQLMRATLKEAYDPELFQTPPSLNSSTESSE